MQIKTETLVLERSLTKASQECEYPDYSPHFFKTLNKEIRFDFDFYLQAHAGLQGHVKATHYTVVYDEIGLSADEIQVGTHDISYLYARATKAVSLIPAAYYADLACERGRCYLNDFLVDDKATTSGTSKLDRDEEKKRVFEAAKRSWGAGVSFLEFDVA